MIVVTGAGGIVGHALVSRLRGLGIKFVAVSRQPDPRLADDGIVCDLSQCESLADAVGATPSAIVHLAAAVPHSQHYPDTEASAALTRRIDTCVEQAARQWGCHVVYASSCGLYDRLSAAIKFETSTGLLRIESPYFAAKLDGERLLSALPRCTVLRLPAPIGPGIPPGLVVSRFVEASLADQTLEVWGSGRREQNFVDTADLADAMIRAVDVAWHGTINIAAAQPVTMLELARTVVAALGRGRAQLCGRPDPRDAETGRYSTDRAIAVLGWAARVPLEHSIRSLAQDLSRERMRIGTP